MEDISGVVTEDMSVVNIIKEGNLEKLKEGLEKGEIDIDARYEGKYLVHYAVEYNQPEILKFLIEKGVQIDFRENEDYSIEEPIELAFLENKIDLVNILAEAGADKNTLLFLAIGRANMDEINRALEIGSDINADYEGTPLIFAIQTGKYDIAKFLIERGADVNKETQTWDEYTREKSDLVPPIYYIFENTRYKINGGESYDEETDIFEFLVSHGLDINKEYVETDYDEIDDNYGGGTRTVVKHEEYNIGTLIKDTFRKDFVAFGHSPVAYYKKIIEAGFDLNKSSHMDIYKEIIKLYNLELIKLCIDRGADASKGLLYASIYISQANFEKKIEEHKAIIKFLIDAGANILEESKSMKGANVFYTPLLYAIEHGNNEIINYMLDKLKESGVRLSEQININKYFQYVIEQRFINDVAIYDKLVEFGADVNFIDTYIKCGMLRYAVLKENTVAVEYLVRKGAKKTDGNARLEIIDLVKRKENPELLDAFLRRHKRGAEECEYVTVEADKEGDWVYDIHEHVADFCATTAAIEYYMKPKKSEAEGMGLEKVIPCFGCERPLTSNDVRYVVSDSFFEWFYEESGDKNISVNTSTYPVILENKVKNIDYKNNGTPNTGFKPNYHNSICPYCLQASEERTHGCAYMKHKHPKDLLIQPVFNKYQNKRAELFPPGHYPPVGELEWCVECGRPSLAHRHFTLDDEPELMELAHGAGGEGIYDVCQGGGRAEMFARLLAIRRELARYTDEEKKRKNNPSLEEITKLREIREACGIAADRAALDAGLMTEAQALAAKEASERRFEGGVKSARKTRRKNRNTAI